MSLKLDLKNAREIERGKLVFFTVQELAKFVNELAEEGDMVNVKNYYVYVSSSIKKSSGIKSFSLDQLDDLIDYYANRVTLKARSLFVAIGIHYEKDSLPLSHDLVMTCTDYTHVVFE